MMIPGPDDPHDPTSFSYPEELQEAVDPPRRASVLVPLLLVLVVVGLVWAL